jgi:Zn-dependent protease/predicted transcriptional regulator
MVNLVDRSAPASERGRTPGTLGGFRLLGVPVRLHFTFLLLLIFLLSAGASGHEAAASYALLLLGLFASVLVHELAHAFVGSRFGVRTTEIVMFPLGGISKMERPLKPREELWVSISGPFANLLLAGGIFGYLAWSRQTIEVKWSELIQGTDQNLLMRLAFGNMLLGVFNLLPAFPMDGGRALRAILSFARPEVEATRVAAWMGRALAIGMGLYGLLAPQFMLVFFAFFIYLGAAQEASAAVGRTLTHGIPVRAAMISDFRTLNHGDEIRDAANLLLSTSQQDFPVMHAGQVVGLLSRNLLLRALAKEGPNAYVAGVMDRNFVRLEPDMDLAKTMPLIQQAGPCALVMEGDKLLGLLTTDNLAEFVMLRRYGMEPAT